MFECVPRGCLFVVPRADRASLRSQAVVAHASCLLTACRAGDLRGRHGGLAVHQGGHQRVGAHRRSPTCRRGDPRFCFVLSRQTARPNLSQHSVKSAAELVGNFGPFERSSRPDPLRRKGCEQDVRVARARARVPGPRSPRTRGATRRSSARDRLPPAPPSRLDPATSVDAGRSGFWSRSRQEWRLIEQFRPTGSTGKTRSKRAMTVVHPRLRNRGCPYALSRVRCFIWRAVGLPIFPLFALVCDHSTLARNLEERSRGPTLSILTGSLTGWYLVCRAHLQPLEG